MSNKISVIAVVAVLAVAVGGGFFMMSQNGVAQSDKETLSRIVPAGADRVTASDPKGEGADGAADAPMLKLGNPVVALVDGKEIKRSDVFAFISGLPEQVRQMPVENLFPLALDQVISNRVIEEKASAAKLENDPEVTQLFEQAQGQIIRNVFVERQVTEAMSQKKLLDAYGELLEAIGKIEETRARHILLNEEDKAREVIAKLNEGAVFEDLAKEYSTGPSGPNGGDLGYFAKTEMVPEFADAAFALDVGGYTKDPVKTQFGWHVIKVEDRRPRPEPKFEDVKPQLEAQLRQKTLNDLMTKWQEDAKIKKFDINGDEPPKETKVETK